MNKSVHEKLHETRSNLVKEIANLTDTQFNSKPDREIWSIAQVCHHLILVEESSIKAIAWGLKEVGNAPIEHKRIDLEILNRTKKNRSPKIVEPEIEPFEVQQIIDLLNDSRKKLIAFLNTIEDKTILAGKSVKHPALGDLSLDQWIEHIYLHEQRHIEQIKDIKLLLDVRC